MDRASGPFPRSGGVAAARRHRNRFVPTIVGAASRLEGRTLPSVAGVAALATAAGQRLTRLYEAEFHAAPTPQQVAIGMQQLHSGVPIRAIPGQLAAAAAMSPGMPAATGVPTIRVSSGSDISGLIGRATALRTSLLDAGAMARGRFVGAPTQTVTISMPTYSPTTVPTGGTTAPNTTAALGATGLTSLNNASPLYRSALANMSLFNTGIALRTGLFNTGTALRTGLFNTGTALRTDLFNIGNTLRTDLFDRAIALRDRLFG
jgi:hypothetical protein